MTPWTPGIRERLEHDLEVQRSMLRVQVRQTQTRAKHLHDTATELGIKFPLGHVEMALSHLRAAESLLSIPHSREAEEEAAA